MKKYFFTGFITLLPIVLTVIITIWLFDLFTEPLVGFTKKILLSYEQAQTIDLAHHDTLALLLSRILAFIILLTLIFLLGFSTRKFASNFLLHITEKIFSKIPFIRTIYRLSHDVTKALFSENKKTFKETVLIPFPHSQSLAIGFVTGFPPAIFKERSHSDLVIFVPTSPHPMSGFVLLAPKSIVTSTDVSIEEAFKFIISCGVIHPNEKIPSK